MHLPGSFCYRHLRRGQCFPSRILRPFHPVLSACDKNAQLQKCKVQAGQVRCCLVQHAGFSQQARNWLEARLLSIWDAPSSGQRAEGTSAAAASASTAKQPIYPAGRQSPDHDNAVSAASSAALSSASSDADASSASHEAVPPRKHAKLARRKGSSETTDRAAASGSAARPLDAAVASKPMDQAASRASTSQSTSAGMPSRIASVNEASMQPEHQPGQPRQEGGHVTASAFLPSSTGASRQPLPAPAVARPASTTGARKARRKKGEKQPPQQGHLGTKQAALSKQQDGASSVIGPATPPRASEGPPARGKIEPPVHATSDAETSVGDDMKVLPAGESQQAVSGEGNGQPRQAAIQLAASSKQQLVSPLESSGGSAAQGQPSAAGGPARKQRQQQQSHQSTGAVADAMGIGALRSEDPIACSRQQGAQTAGTVKTSPRAGQGLSAQQLLTFLPLPAAEVDTLSTQAAQPQGKPRERGQHPLVDSPLVHQTAAKTHSQLQGQRPRPRHLQHIWSMPDREHPSSTAAILTRRPQEESENPFLAAISNSAPAFQQSKETAQRLSLPGTILAKGRQETSGDQQWDQGLCLSCEAAPREALLAPCGHIVFCGYAL